jgi:hypothetical protein
MTATFVVADAMLINPRDSAVVGLRFLLCVVFFVFFVVIFSGWQIVFFVVFFVVVVIVVVSFASFFYDGESEKERDYFETPTH